MNKKSIEVALKSIVSIIITSLGYVFIHRYSPPNSSLQKAADLLAMVLQIIIITYAFYKDVYNKPKFRYESVVLGGVVGLSIALVLIGLSTLNPRNINWIMREMDRTQHFLGWNFFVKDNWHFPLGYFDNWGYPDGMSVIFTDSIPVVAIFFKIFKGILPSTFQYLGMWLFLSFILMGAFTAFIFDKVTDELVLKVLASVFFIATPIMFLRVEGHTSLTSHWLILWAIYLIINQGYERKHLISWTVLIGLTVFIHPYFLFMVYIIFLFYLFKGIFLDKNLKLSKAFVLVIITFAIVLGIMFIEGYFRADTKALDAGFGEFSFNLNGFYNPIGNSRFLKDALAYPWQYEGLAYLGIGGILVIFLALIDLIREGFDKSKKNLYIVLIVTCLTFFIISLSNKITFYEHFFVIPIGSVIRKLWSIVRATGRMIWPVWYIMALYAFFKVIKSTKRNRDIVIGLIVAVQLLDLSGMYITSRNRFFKEEKWETPLKNEFWVKAVKEYKHISMTKVVKEYAPIAYLASMNGLTMDYGYFARDPKNLEENLNGNRTEILSGNYAEDTLYILNHDKETIEKIKSGPNRNLLRSIDGYVVYSPKGF